MGNADFYVLLGSNETGPWTLGQVQIFWRAGAVTAETLYADSRARHQRGCVSVGAG